MWTNIFLRLFLKIVASGKKGGHNSSVLCGWMKTKDLLCKTIHTTSHGNAPFPKKLQAAAVSRFVDCPRSVVIAMIRCCHLTHPPRLSHCSCFLSIYGVPFVFMWTDQCNVDTDLCTSINVKGNMMSFRCCEHWNREVKSWLCDALFGGSTKRCYKVTEPCFVWCMLKCHTSWGGGASIQGFFLLDKVCHGLLQTRGADVVHGSPRPPVDRLHLQTSLPGRNQKRARTIRALL